MLPSYQYLLIMSLLDAIASAIDSASIQAYYVASHQVLHNMTCSTSNTSIANLQLTTVAS